MSLRPKLKGTTNTLEVDINEDSTAALLCGGGEYQIAINRKWSDVIAVQAIIELLRHL